MNNLKELTQEQHKNAERSLFVKKLLKKQITPYEYYVYLGNQFMMYAVLEQIAHEAGCLDGIEEIRRETKIAEDLRELEKEYGFEPLQINYTLDYMRYVYKLADEPDRLLAHIYVRHMGDLSGGQIIKKFVPGSGKMYEFSTDVDELKSKLRSKLHDGMAEEANFCFKMIGKFMTELEKQLGIKEVS